MTLFIFLALVFLLVVFVIEAGILFGISRVFKIEKSNYKKSLQIVFLFFIFIFAVNVLLVAVDMIIKIGVLSDILAIFVYLLIFGFLLLKYYKISWKKVLAVCITFFSGVFLLILVTVVPIRLYVFSPFVVSGYSMSPNFVSGDYLLVKKFDREFDSGDVVVYRYPKDTSKLLIHRIIGTPSDKLEIKDGTVYINDKELEEKYLSTKRTKGDILVTLKDGEYFMMGDNRDKAFDSRKFGIVPKAYIIGKMFYKVSGLMD